MQIGPQIIAAFLTGLAVLLVFMAIWVLLQQHDPVEERLSQYGVTTGSVAPALGDTRLRYTRSRLERFLAAFGLGPQLALALTRADLPLTAAEFILVVIALAGLGFAIGTLRVGLLFGAILAAVFVVLAIAYLRMRQRRRLRAFTQQLPDVLTLLIGSLRAGYGFNQAIEVVVDRASAPASVEFERVMRAVNLGIPLQRALQDAVERVGSDDFNMVVVAVNIQAETGGNLVETLEIISDTVRDRLRLLSEIRVMTAQQRFTGYILGLLPFVVAILIFLLNPDYVGDLFQPGWIRILPITAVVLQLLGFYVISRIVDIEV